MKIGVYFTTPADTAELLKLGVTYAVRPIVTPATGPNDAGFVSDSHIYQLDDPSYHENYGADEIDDPTYGATRLRLSLPGSFVNISNGGWGFRDHLIPPDYHRGLENGGGDLIAPLRCWWSAHMSKWHWGTDWTVILYATLRLRRALGFYRRLGVARAFIWRWDTQKDLIRRALA